MPTYELTVKVRVDEPDEMDAICTGQTIEEILREAAWVKKVQLVEVLEV